MTEFSIAITGEAELNRKFEELRKKLIDPSGALKSIGEAALLQVDSRFEREIDPSGAEWQPLSAYTLAQKAKQGRIMKRLQSTGMMRSRVNYRVTSATVAIGIADEKARKHQLGIGVPKREILGVNPENLAEFIEILDQFLTL